MVAPWGHAIRPVAGDFFKGRRKDGNVDKLSFGEEYDMIIDDLIKGLYDYYIEVSQNHYNPNLLNKGKFRTNALRKIDPEEVIDESWEKHELPEDPTTDLSVSVFEGKEFDDEVFVFLDDEKEPENFDDVHFIIVKNSRLREYAENNKEKGLILINRIWIRFLKEQYDNIHIWSNNEFFLAYNYYITFFGQPIPLIKISYKNKTIKINRIKYRETRTGLAIVEALYKNQYEILTSSELKKEMKKILNKRGFEGEANRIQPDNRRSIHSFFKNKNEVFDKIINVDPEGRDNYYELVDLYKDRVDIE